MISTYVTFTILPDLLWTFDVVPRYNIEFLVTLMYGASHLADGIIYIFMHDRVKKILYKKLNNIACVRAILGNDTLAIETETPGQSMDDL